MSSYVEENNEESILVQNNMVSLPLVPKPPSSKPTEDLTSPTLQDKEKLARNPSQYYVKASFMITYILLLTTGTVTFTESLRTTNVQNRHMLNLQTCISVVSGYFYSLYLNKIDSAEKVNNPIEWSYILKTRYLDWAITMPVMLIVLCSVLATIANKKLMFSTMSSVIVLNYVTLIFGLVGEIGSLNTYIANLFSMSALATMFYIIYKSFLDTTRLDSVIVYGFYLLVWLGYRVSYMFNNTYKNIGFNVLDFVSKTLFGLGLWLYYSKLVTV